MASRRLQPRLKRSAGESHCKRVGRIVERRPSSSQSFETGPCTANAASGWRLSLPVCSASAFFSFVLSVTLVGERLLHFQLNRNNISLTAFMMVLSSTFWRVLSMWI